MSPTWISAHQQHCVATIFTLQSPVWEGFFAEAYAYSNLPLISHTFLLRLSRFSDVYDEIRCRLYLDANRVLRLEKNEGPNRPLFKSESSIAVSSQPDDQEQRPEIKDRASFDAWLKGQSREIAVAIAAR